MARKRKKRSRSRSRAAARSISHKKPVLDSGRESVPVGRRRLVLGLFVLLLLTAAVQYGWNDYTLPPIIGYDAKYHAQYIETIAKERRLPDPLEGWSTFHPPFYYLIGSVLWNRLVPEDFSDPDQVARLMLGLRGISAIAILVAGGVGFWLALSRNPNAWVALLASALVLFVPCAQMAASMIGNEALATAMAALALIPLQKLQRDPRSLSAAALTGLFAGLALITKYTGIFVAGAAIVPFLRKGIDRRMVHAMLLGGLVGGLVAGPVYARNYHLTGSLVPMTRTLEPMKSAEAKFVLRPRRITDYLWINPACLWRPSIYHVAGKEGSRENRNPAMGNVWGLAYAGMWYDAFGHRVPGSLHRDGEYAGPVLTILGIVPTAVMLLGFVLALIEWIRKKSASADAPILAMSLLGLTALIVFTWRAPSAAAVKASYLLPLIVPAAAFYARGIDWLGPRTRLLALTLSLVAVSVAAYIFTNGAYFELLRGHVAH